MAPTRGIPPARSRHQVPGDGILRKLKIGRPNYYINIALNHVLVGDTTSEEGQQA